MVTRSRKTKKIPIDSAQYYRLVNVGEEIGHYDSQPQARRDNLELVLTTVLDHFEEEHIDE